ncbi:ABC transporter substrate-binding protein [Ilumatobacter nonamiensis]|uniref:ABC transporter substrate-binding protein n=1 Tax=Ilumatobacter nonamiensis TaxID=467093 RepID=UPI0003449821|nr:hypothetical protein [Ilumatobacter nonamiensis]
MQPASAEGSNRDTSRALRRYGPIAAIAAVALVVVGVVIFAGGDDAAAPVTTDDETAETETAETDAAEETEATEAAEEETAETDEESAPESAPDSEPATSDDSGETETPESPLPEGVMSFSVAEELGLDVDFGERCDPELGTVKIQWYFANECYAPFEGDNGGATARGVTEDTITIVQWVSQDVDPILNYITDAIANDDTNAQEEETLRNLLPYYETYYETYGRSVELIVVEGSGTINDEAAARADAVRIDEEYDPFMVWGGPTLTNAFAEELAARGIPCISCGPSQTSDWYTDNAGLAYGIAKGPDQLDALVAEYIGKRLAGDPAIHAGDETMHDTERVFGRIWIESSPDSITANEGFEAAAADNGFEIAESQSYTLDPATLQESAATVIARMKEAGVTSVIFNGDPIAPREFTNEATAQNYFPEWVVTGSALVDTTAFSRTYDQQQWANAFGVSNLAARVDRSIGGSYAIYEWYVGEPPPAPDSIDVITPIPNVFYAFLQGAGPNLTIESFNDAAFIRPPTPRGVTAPTLSWGAQEIWPDEFEPDYRGVDDVTEIWWDPEAPGLDEIDRDGNGLWRYVDGGTRYNPGEIPEGPPSAFVEEGTVTIYTEPPPEEARPAYEPIR